MTGQPDPAVGERPAAGDDAPGPGARRAPRPSGSFPGHPSGDARTVPRPSPGAAGTPGDAAESPEGRDAGDADFEGGTGPATAAPPDIAVLSAQRDEYLGALQLMKADFDNYRKRVARQQEEQAARAAADLVAKLLPVIDNLDLAWAHLGEGRPADEVSEEARALAQARQQLLDVLGKEGLVRVDETEVPFDPTVHDAVAHVPAEPASDGDVVSVPGDDASDPDAVAPVSTGGGVAVDGVMRAGYRWRGQVLRPAMVRVRG